MSFWSNLGKAVIVVADAHIAVQESKRADTAVARVEDRILNLKNAIKAAGKEDDFVFGDDIRRELRKAQRELVLFEDTKNSDHLARAMRHVDRAEEDANFWLKVHV